MKFLRISVLLHPSKERQALTQVGYWFPMDASVGVMCSLHIRVTPYPIKRSWGEYCRWSQIIAHRSKACSSESPDADGSFTFLHEPEDDMKCVICLSVAEDPLQHEECGKLFCNECIENIEKHGKDKPCPHCKTEGQFYKDKKSEFKCKLCSHRSSTHSESEKSCKTFWISEG